MTSEQQHLTGLVEKAFQYIEYYDTIGYKCCYLDGEMMTQMAEKEGREVIKYKLFRNSELYDLVKEELRGYVLSDNFRNNVFLDHFDDEIKEVRPVPVVLLDGSVDIDIDTAREVKNYLIEVSRIGNLFEYNEPFRDWFTEQFLQNRKGRDSYIRGACRTLLHQSRERRITFDDALGFKMEAAVDTEHLVKKARGDLSYVIRSKKRIQAKELYQKVLHKIQESSSQALLFSHPVISYLVGQSVRYAPRSIPALRLEYFLEVVNSRGVINAFENCTPYPLHEPLRSEILREPGLELSYWQEDQAEYSSLVAAFKLKRFSLPLISDPSLRLVTERTPKDKLEDRVRLEISRTLRFIKWNDQELELFSRKVINHLLNDPKAYDFFAQSRLVVYEKWPMIVEQLGIQHRPVLGALVEEIKTGRSQRLENKFKPEISAERQRFTSEVYPSREIEHDGQKYVFEIDRSLVSVIHILFNREERDQTLRDGDAPQSIARVLADFDNQFISVYKISEEHKDPVGAVWLDGSDRLGGDRLDYFDEIDDLGKLALLRTELMKYVEEFSRHCGYSEVVFDSNDLIRGIPP